MHRSRVTTLHFLLISLLVAATAWTPSAVQAQLWSFGIRGEYMALGGDQFATLSGGYGASGFVRRHLGNQGSVELGARVTRHRMWVVCFSDDCIRYVHRTFAEGYIRPAIRAKLPGTAIRPYAGLDVGVMAGDFPQDPSPGLAAGGVVGFAIPFGDRLAAEVGVTGTMVYVGTDLPRSGWGRRLNLQLGLAVR